MPASGTMDVPGPQRPSRMGPMRHSPSGNRSERRDLASSWLSTRVKKTVLVYGILGGVLIAILKAVEYRFLVLEHSLEIYGGIIALLFAALGIWLGLKLTRTRETVVVREVTVPVEVRVPVHVPVSGPFARNEARLEQLGITRRELEILEAMAAGCRITRSGDAECGWTGKTVRRSPARSTFRGFDR